MIGFDQQSLVYPLLRDAAALGKSHPVQYLKGSPLMATTQSNTFKHAILNSSETSKTASQLQGCLVTLVDLSLALKQLHWNVVGVHFRPVHLQLDEIIDTVRDASDEVAERISTLGVSPDGRSSTVAQESVLGDMPTTFVMPTPYWRSLQTH